MYDTYKHIILRDGSFTAGYKHFHMHHNSAQDRQVLFTTLRFIRVISGHAVWQVGTHRIAVAPGDIISVNNMEVRQFLSVEDDFHGEIFVVQNAVRLMINDSINILDAAMLSGFGSSSGFYKTFRAVCGMSPGEYLKYIRSTST